MAPTGCRVSHRGLPIALSYRAFRDGSRIRVVATQDDSGIFVVYIAAKSDAFPAMLELAAPVLDWRTFPTAQADAVAAWSPGRCSGGSVRVGGMERNGRQKRSVIVWLAERKHYLIV